LALIHQHQTISVVGTLMRKSCIAYVSIR
jgi:hypothetical protein